MKTRQIISSALMVILIIIFLAGCSLLNDSWENYYKNHPTYQMQLEKQIGIMKYDDGLANWGEPISVFQGDEVFVVTWGSEKVGPTVTTAIPIGRAAIVSTRQKRSGWEISATFSKESRILKTIKYEKW